MMARAWVKTGESDPPPRCARQVFITTKPEGTNDMTDTATTRYTATITHHSIARARIVEVGGEHGEYLILITDTSQPEYACERIAATRRVADSGW